MTSRGFLLPWKQVQSFTPMSNLPPAAFSDHLPELTSPNPSSHSLLTCAAAVFLECLLLRSVLVRGSVESFGPNSILGTQPTQSVESFGPNFFACALHETFPNTLTGSNAHFYELLKVILNILKIPCDSACVPCPFQSGTLSSHTVPGPTPHAKTVESFLQTSLFPIL